MHARIALVFLLCGAPLAGAQSTDQPGPWTVGWRDVVFQDTIFGEGQIRGRMYYPALSTAENAPADPSGGPYFLSGFMHGYLGSPDGYDLLCTHLASWGFVVASTGTETGIFPDVYQYARDTRSFLHWVEQESQDPGSWLFGMTGPGDWACSGHSMGGGTLPLLTFYEPRVRFIVPLEPGDGDAFGHTAMQNFTGAVQFLAGSADGIVPPAVVRAWFADTGAARRSFYHEAIGMGHFGPTDTPGIGGSMSGADEARLSRRLLTAFLLAEMRGEEDLYVELLGEGIAGEPMDFEARCQEPPLWARLSAQVPQNLAVGVAGTPGARVALAWSLTPASVNTRFGLLGLDLNAATVFFRGGAGATGAAEAYLPVNPAWSGQIVYLQGFAGRLSRTGALAFP